MLISRSGELAETASCKYRSWHFLSNGSGYVELVTPQDGREDIIELIPAIGLVVIKQQFRQRRYIEVRERNRVYSYLTPTYRPKKPMTCEVDAYAVDKVQPQYPGTRAFVMLNLYDTEQREPYLVHVGGIDTCRCQAGVCKVERCKHRCTMQAIISTGCLDGVYDQLMAV